jgi:hypothetical protein
MAAQAVHVSWFPCCPRVARCAPPALLDTRATTSQSALTIEARIHGRFSAGCCGAHVCTCLHSCQRFSLTTRTPIAGRSTQIESSLPCCCISRGTILHAYVLGRLRTVLRVTALGPGDHTVARDTSRRREDCGQVHSNVTDVTCLRSSSSQCH